MKFPSKLEWIEECGFAELRAEYKSFLQNEKDDHGFENFVNDMYESAKDMYENEMNECRKHLSLSFKDEEEIDVEMAKQVLITIINKGIDNKEVQKIIENEDLSPDFRSNLAIVDAFWDKVLPAFENAMKNLK